MDAQFGKAILDHGVRRFAGVAATPEFGVQFIANICFSRAGAFETHAAVADQLARGLEGDGQLKLDARLRLLLRQEHGDKIARTLLGLTGQFVVAQIARIGLICQHRRPVVRYEFAQAQPRGDDLHQRTCSLF